MHCFVESEQKEARDGKSLSWAINVMLDERAGDLSHEKGKQLKLQSILLSVKRMRISGLSVYEGKSQIWGFRRSVLQIFTFIHTQTNFGENTLQSLSVD